MWQVNNVDFKIIVGKVFHQIVIDKDEIIFIVDDYEKYVMDDEPNCQQYVIEDISGDVEDLLNSPILKAEATSEEDCDSNTYPIYHISTIKGSVTIRWRETADIAKI